MIDPNHIDPLAELESAQIEILKLKHDIRILIKHDGETQEILKEISSQLATTSQLLRVARQEIRDLNLFCQGLKKTS